MADPVVHFEIVGTDPERLREYYQALFGWDFATPSPVAAEVSDADQYGFLDLIQTDDGAGIRGGIGGGADFTAHAIFYVGVASVGAALERAEALAAHGSWTR
jgi:predicted enzyme related to lactoylglutathione lyase